MKKVSHDWLEVIWAAHLRQKQRQRQQKPWSSQNRNVVRRPNTYAPLSSLCSALDNVSLPGDVPSWCHSFKVMLYLLSSFALYFDLMSDSIHAFFQPKTRISKAHCVVVQCIYDQKTKTVLCEMFGQGGGRLSVDFTILCHSNNCFCSVILNSIC